MACFISASGELLLPTFIDVHVNQSFADLKWSLKGELKAEYIKKGKKGKSIPKRNNFIG